MAPPLEIQTTVTPTGVLLGFALPADERALADRRAWGFFSAAIFILLASITWYAACRMAGWYALANLGLVPFGLGLVGLVVAGTSSSAGRGFPDRSDDLRELAVAGDLLIRTARDDRKRLWYREEIWTVYVDEDGTDAASPLVRLVLDLKNGEQAVLHHQLDVEAPGDARTRLDGVASLLRRVLDLERDSSHAIQATADYLDQNRAPRTSALPRDD